MRILPVIGLLFPIFLHAQQDSRDVLNPNRLRIKEMVLTGEDTASRELKLPFSKIRIIDSRPDTSKIGYAFDNDIFTGKKRSFQRVQFRNGNGHAIERYYAAYFSNAFTQNDFELLIVMKRFWLSANVISNEKRVEASNSVGADEKLYCKWEYYLGKNGKYLPAKRVDTVLIIAGDPDRYNYYKTERERYQELKSALNKLVEMLDYSNAVNQFDNQPGKTLEQIYTFNNRLNMIPVLQDTAIRRGVYLNFEEFKNNRPSILDFTEKKTRYRLTNTENYLENAKGETISNYWGYSDGQVIRYGMLGNEKMFRVQNTFCFFIKVSGYVVNRNTKATDLTTNNAIGRRNSVEPVSKSKFEIWVPYQIDMETGTIY